MSSEVVRILLFAFTAYMVLKTATAPRRGRFLTAFGNISRDAQPTAFKVCVVGGYALAAILALAAAYTPKWLPMFSGLSNT